MSQIAAIQMASGPNVNSNLIEAARLITNAVQAGAQMVVLPENFAFFGKTEADKFAHAEDDGQGPMQEFLVEQAKKHSIWIVGGTVPIRGDDKEHLRQVCMLFNDEGVRVARYDKMHLFDVHISATDENYKESETIEPGNEVVVVDTPFGKLGIAICYDLRFPELFRRMLDKGVEIIVLPSAFTAITGKAHWESLVRARAIENLSYFIAADQGGYHVNGRETYGDSMIVDPWGLVLDRLPSGSGFIIAEVECKHVGKVRSNFPAHLHRRISCELLGENL